MIDKTLNIVVICKICYAEVILREIGALADKYHTYCKAVKYCKKIIGDNSDYTEQLECIVTEKEKALPSMYCIPKMHKNQIGACIMNIIGRCYEHLNFGQLNKTQDLF